jgi:hypothetical protein
VTRFARTAAAALAASFAIGAGAVAYVRAADEPSGYVGKGQLVIRTALGGNTQITIGGDIAMEESGSRIRIDVLSLAIPGESVTINTLLATQLFPPGGFTLVYDRADSSYTVWASSKQRYYTNTTAAPASAAPALAPGGGGGTTGDLFSIFAFARSLKNDTAFDVSLGLAGHQTVDGHPATGLNFQYLRTLKDNDTIDIHGTFQFADDLDGLPVEISVDGKSRSFPESAFRLDFTSLTKQTPAASDFFPPSNYTRVNGIGDVIGKSLPIPNGQ